MPPFQRSALGELADCYFVKGGDVVFRSRGAPSTAAAIDDALTEPVLVVSPLFILRPDTNYLLPAYLGECYIYLISRFASDAGKKAGEFYTPTAVSRLLAKLAAPAPGSTICDPACGSGSLLIQASQEVGSENFALYGQEVNGATWALARDAALRVV